MLMVLHDRLTGMTLDSSDVKTTKAVSTKLLRYPSKYKALRAYSLSWSCRLQMEAFVRPAMYLTFTFENEPESYLTDEDRSAISDPDCPLATKRMIYRGLLTDIWQRFIKRFRFNLVHDDVVEDYQHLDFKYYAITERGDHNTERLHFHALFYGFEFTTFKGYNKKGQQVDFVNFSPLTECIEKSWSLGHVTFNGANDRAINYVTKYIHKRAKWAEYVSLKSHGLGLAYLTQERVDHFKETLNPEFHMHGKKFYLPRYIKSKVFTVAELAEINKPFLISVKEKELYDKMIEFKDKVATLPESGLCKFFMIDEDQDTLRDIYGYDPSIDKIYFGQFVPDEIFFRCKDWHDDQIRFHDCFTKRIT